MKVSGIKIKCKVKVFSLGKTAENILGNTITEKNKVMVFLNGKLNNLNFLNK